MSNPLIRARSSREFLTGERCHIREILNDADAPAVSLARCRVTAGVTTELHRLSVTEYYLISSGHGRMEVGDHAPFDVSPGDTVVIPAGTAQRIRNTGTDDLVFQCLCLPRFVPECYESLA